MRFTKAKIVAAGMILAGMCMIAPQQLRAEVPKTQMDGVMGQSIKEEMDDTQISDVDTQRDGLLSTYAMPRLLGASKASSRYTQDFLDGSFTSKVDYTSVTYYHKSDYEDEQLLNLLEFFRKYPDEKVDKDQYENYCMMFYDYTDILEASYFQNHKDMAEQLAMQILVSVLKGDQNYHYENIAFVCNKKGEILRLAPMIDHEFSTYFMFPDNSAQHMYWYSE